MCTETQTVVNQNTTNNTNITQTLPLDIELHTMSKIQEGLENVEANVQRSYALSKLLYFEVVDSINSDMVLTTEILIGTLSAINFFASEIHKDFKDVFSIYKALYNLKNVDRELQSEAEGGVDCE